MSEQEHVAIESLSVESTGPGKGGAGLENGLASAHTINHGWTWGITSLILVGLVTPYANWPLAEFQFIDGRRFVRYRDLTGHLFGQLLISNIV
ncbi:amino acid transporter, transmembrane domain-containing protein [Artemisia annua]|uniref:Amino acid transporter, transmembrane domain-containing protein n=1 Tax=Artemisia annua TaxID=35608 RepID=A0A2U1KQR5_ARTAN|nr:amino acid transporter, transmembrane domain-containing protein [Artemisia annua]